MTEAGLAALPSLRGTPLKGSLRLPRKWRAAHRLMPVERFITNCTYLDAEQKSGALQFCLRGAKRQDPILPASTVPLSSASDEADFLNQMLYLDTKIFMTSLNLTYNDKMSMASSVEVRVPFLDRELAEFVAWNVPPSMKLKGSCGPPRNTSSGRRCTTFCRERCCSNRKPALPLR